ncbi:MAG: TVP38/TMEM64 family protein, partial [Thermodesulfovibrionales bacterium]
MSKNKAKKLAILLVVAFVIVMFRIFHLEQYLSLTYLKESQARFAILYEQHRPAVLTTYLATYILVTTLSLPGAVVLTLAGGALFGLVTGTVQVSF